MKLERKARSLALNVLFSRRALALRRWLAEKRRQVSGREHVVSVFLQLDDPYSYILSHYLPSLAANYDIDLRLYLSQARGDEFQPAPDMLAEYAVIDCSRLARELGIPFLDKGHLPPTEHRVGLTNAIAAAHGTDEFEVELREALEVFWRGDSSAAASMSISNAEPAVTNKIIDQSRRLLQKLGHYNTAMLHYAGEWFWGVDRLHYLLTRLDELGQSKSQSADPLLASIKQAMAISLPVRPPTAAKELPPIEFFHSFRSPFSYIALEQVFAIANAFGIDVKIRPVLPMIMRGMKVPRQKLLYLAHDACREARRRNVPFGRISDPLGTGAERCLAVSRFAESEHREREFAVNAGRAIWAEAVDVATDEGMRKVTGRSGLFWPEAKAVMQNDDWRESIEGNRESMMNAGSWGVPTIRMGDFIIWGQDRDWLLVRHIEEHCDTGDGILV